MFAAQSSSISFATETSFNLNLIFWVCKEQIVKSVSLFALVFSRGLCYT